MCSSIFIITWVLQISSSTAGPVQIDPSMLEVHSRRRTIESIPQETLQAEEIQVPQIGQGIEPHATLCTSGPRHIPWPAVPPVQYNFQLSKKLKE